MSICPFIASLTPYVPTELVSALKAALLDEPIQFVEIGGAGGGDRFAELGSYTHYHCFEPSPTTYMSLAARALPNNVTLNPYGLGDTDGAMPLFIFGDNSRDGNSIMSAPNGFSNIGKISNRFPSSNLLKLIFI